MTAVLITPADPLDPPVTELICEWLAVSEALTPNPESRHAFPAERLADPRISFFAAWTEDRHLLGCAALYRHDAALGEVKSMYVRPTARGQGIAWALLERVMETARAEGLQRLSLETGFDFEAAIALYAKAGFTMTGPFASYRLDPLSAFMTKALT